MGNSPGVENVGKSFIIPFKFMLAKEINTITDNSPLLSIRLKGFHN